MFSSSLSFSSFLSQSIFTLLTDGLMMHVQVSMYVITFSVSRLCSFIKCYDGTVPGCVYGRNTVGSSSISWVWDSMASAVSFRSMVDWLNILGLMGLAGREVLFILSGVFKCLLFFSTGPFGQLFGGARLTVVVGLPFPGGVCILASDLLNTKVSIV